MADFPASPKPDYPLEETMRDWDVVINRHRDGTEARTLRAPGRPAGYRLRWGHLTAEELEAFQDHYAGQEGRLLAFDWVHPERGGAARVVRYDGPPRAELVSFDHWTLEVDFAAVTA